MATEGCSSVQRLRDLIEKSEPRAVTERKPPAREEHKEERPAVETRKFAVGRKAKQVGNVRSDHESSITQNHEVTGLSIIARGIPSNPK